MPARAARVFRVIENSDPELFALDLARVIHPVRRLSPNRLFMLHALGVGDGASVRQRAVAAMSGGAGFLQHRCDAESERAVFRIAKCDFRYGGQSDVEIDNAKVWV